MLILGYPWSLYRDEYIGRRIIFGEIYDDSLLCWVCFGLVIYSQDLGCQTFPSKTFYSVKAAGLYRPPYSNQRATPKSYQCLLRRSAVLYCIHCSKLLGQCKKFQQTFWYKSFNYFAGWRSHPLLFKKEANTNETRQSTCTILDCVCNLVSCWQALGHHYLPQYFAHSTS